MGGITDSVLGKKENTQQQSYGTQFTNFQQPDANAIRSQQGNVIGAANQFSGFANQLAGQGLQNVQGINTNFSQFNPNLNTNFAQFNPTQGLDAQSQQLMSQEMGNRAAAQNTQAGQISQQFRNNPALAAILNSQNAAVGQLNNNPLAFQAGQNQQQRELGTFQANQGAQQLGNQAQLAQSQQLAQLLGMGNQAQQQQLSGLGQVLGFAGQGAQSQNALLQSLAQIGQMFGQQVSSSEQSSQSGAPGLLERTMGFDPAALVNKYNPIAQAGANATKK
jgi:hypothetical protein